MEYELALSGRATDLAAINEALRAVDPAALADIHPSGTPLRLSTSLPAREIAALLTASGFDTATESVQQQPSTCCGGCSG